MKKVTQQELIRRLRDAARTIEDTDKFIETAVKYLLPPMTIETMKEEFKAFGVDNLTNYHASVNKSKEKAV